MPEGMPVFIKIEEYKDVLDVIALIKSKLAEARNSLEKIESLKAEEDSAIDSWKAQLDGVQDKIDFIDNSLFEPEI
ncbi:hypothetical protein GF351_04590 [Candidatus Woesearchaeota archaeon]|nr:hypothetical protein [Candidatus Woesearchaeota archaeon]